MINVTALRRVLEFITTRNERHYQDVWTDTEDVPDSFFTTVTNVVDPEGHPVCVYGGERGRVEVLQPNEEWSCGTVACLAGWAALLNGWRPIRRESDLVYRDGRAEPVIDVARRVLDLDRDQAETLFVGSNSLEQLWQLASRYTDGQIQVPNDLPAERFLHDDDDDDDDDYDYVDES